MLMTYVKIAVPIVTFLIGYGVSETFRPFDSMSIALASIIAFILGLINILPYELEEVGMK